MILHTLETWWTALGRRERIMVLVAASVVFAGAIYVVAVEPAWQTRSRLLRELPRLHEEMVALESLRAEAQRLAGRTGVSMSGSSLREAAQQSVERANLVADVGEGQAGTVSVTAQNVTAHGWFAWLEAFTRETRATVHSARVVRSSNPARVEATVTFRAQPG